MTRIYISTQKCGASGAHTIYPHLLRYLRHFLRPTYWGKNVYQRGKRGRLAGQQNLHEKIYSALPNLFRIVIIRKKFIDNIGGNLAMTLKESIFVKQEWFRKTMC